MVGKEECLKLRNVSEGTTPIMGENFQFIILIISYSKANICLYM